MLGKQIAKQMYSLVENNEESLREALAALEAEKTELSQENVEKVEVQAEEVAEKVEFGSAKIAGEDVEIYFPGDEITEGTPIFEDEAMEVPKADGTYELESGITITVAGGMIDSIEEPGAEEEEAPAEEEDMAEESVSLDAIVQEFAPIFEAIDARVTALEEAVGAKDAELQSKEEELAAEKAKVEKLSATPAAGHIDNNESRLPSAKKNNFGNATMNKFFNKMGTTNSL